MKRILLVPILALGLFVSAQPASAQSCASLTYNLYFGRTDAQTGGEVSKLQAMLGGQVTGYFGPLTEQLVEAFQAGQGVVSSGTPETTGFGAVGPRTRALLATSCASMSGGSSNTDTSSATESSSKGSFSYTLLNKALDPGEGWIEGADLKFFVIGIKNTSALTQTLTFPNNCWYRYRIYNQDTNRVVYDLSKEQKCIDVDEADPTNFAIKPGEGYYLDFDHPDARKHIRPGSYRMSVDVHNDRWVENVASFPFRIVGEEEENTTGENGLVAEFISSAVDVTPDQGIAQFEITLELTATDGDVYVSTSKFTEDTSLSSVLPKTGWNFDLTGATVPTGASALSSTAHMTEGENAYVIREGDTEEFTLNVVSTTTSSGGQLKLGAIQFGTSWADLYTQTLYLDDDEFATKKVETDVSVSSFEASPKSVVAGQSSILKWTSKNAKTCDLRVTSPAGRYVAALGTSGTYAVSPTVTTIYNMYCSRPGPGGTTMGTSFDSKEVTVTVGTSVSSVTFPKSTYDVENPTLTGTAKNLDSFTLMLTGIQDKYADVVFVKNGKWSHKVAIDLPNGTYGVEAYDPKGNLLGSGVFRVLVDDEVVENTTYKGVTAVGVYEGSYTASNPRVFQGNVEGYVNVNVTGDAGGDNQDLVLTSYEPVNWILNVQSGVKIKKIIVAGYNKSRVTNVPAGTEVEYHSYATDGTYYYAYQASGDSYIKMKKWLTGLYPATDGELYGKFVLPGYSASTVDVYLGWKG